MHHGFTKGFIDAGLIPLAFWFVPCQYIRIYFNWEWYFNRFNFPIL